MFQYSGHSSVMIFCDDSYEPLWSIMIFLWMANHFNLFRQDQEVGYSVSVVGVRCVPWLNRIKLHSLKSGIHLNNNNKLISYLREDTLPPLQRPASSCCPRI
jgi:hypothetical protein